MSLQTERTKTKGKKKMATKKVTKKTAKPKNEFEEMDDNEQETQKIHDEDAAAEVENEEIGQEIKDEENDQDRPSENDEEESDYQESEDESESDSYDEESNPQTKFDFKCPKCGTEYIKDKMKEVIVHVLIGEGGKETGSYYCAPCSHSWLERSGAKMATVEG